MSTELNNQTQEEDVRVSFFRSIQGQLVIWFLVLGLLPLALMGLVAYTSAENALRDSIQDGLQAVAETKAIRVEDWLTDSKRMAQNIAALPSIAGESRRDSKYGVEAITRYQDNTEYRAEYREAYDTALDTIQVFIDTYNRIDAAVLMAPDGEVVLSTLEGVDEGSNGNDYPTIPFKEGLEDTFASEVNHSVVDDTEIFVITAPITNPAGELVGVVAARINLNTLEKVMSETTGLGETGETYIVDADTFLMLNQSRHTVEKTILTTEVNTYGVQQALTGDSKGRDDYIDYRGVPIVGAWRYLEVANWVVLAEIDQEEAYAPVYGLAGIIIGIAIAAVLVIAVAAYFIARTISQPVTRVAEAAVRISSGSLSERAKVQSRNEVGILARAFNHMTDNLQQMMVAERESREYLEQTVAEYMQFVSNVASGDLTNRLELNGNGSRPRDETEDELYQLGVNLNAMVEGLGDMALQIRETASGVSAAAAEIRAATTQQMSSTTQQEAAVTQTATTVEEVRATVSQTATRAQAVADASRQSVDVSRDGQESVVDTIEGMQLIRQRVESIATNILMLSERTQQIGEIIASVNEIADQSKLLALNASIEAARAGEEGKGFAVVAMEVRQLAEQSREATARVRDILGEIQQATNTAVMVTEEGSKGAESGMSVAERAGEAIRDLAATIEEAAQAATQIAASTHQQTNGMDQLVSAMESIKQASTQSAASTRQAERSAQDLLDMARQMEEAVARYRL